YTVTETLAKVVGENTETPLTMLQNWQVRKARPAARRLTPSVPLVSGQRIVDVFFPIAKGGTSGIPGGFGTGKTVIQHNLAKWCDAD
ncbi:MAG: V-type ATP synthase subunit A, partial [Desulfuromonadales bacterium]|nr:V-type ATP synthase subunit A [Desulfuromonadales bacterium]NIR33192.1 V-type ATP synthase subunit A [Desulfuromonadales bacterium]NIS41978.1 V-type ATP synthase subunit A [Desulfuromonadales bacterium]